MRGFFCGREIYVRIGELIPIGHNLQNVPTAKLAMWLIQLALKRPYTFAVLAIVILLGGSLSARTVQKDIFPNIEIPVISVI